MIHFSRTGLSLFEIRKLSLFLSLSFQIQFISLVKRKASSTIDRKTVKVTKNVISCYFRKWKSLIFSVSLPSLTHLQLAVGYVFF